MYTRKRQRGIVGVEARVKMCINVPHGVRVRGGRKYEREKEKRLKKEGEGRDRR